MTADEVRRVADAVLYEGYILYPYRASAQKNRSRWQFGVVVPPAFAAADPSESSTMRAECVFEHSGEPSVEVTLRFLQVQRRHSDDAPSWDEAVDREVTVTVGSPALLEEETANPFQIPGGEDTETVHGARVVRRREPLTGSVSVRTTPLPGPWGASRLTIDVKNETEGSPASRDEALPGALVAAHMIITLSGGSFVSMTDPPEWASPAVAECESVGCWPTLAGPKDSKNTMLASPIILPEYAEIAAESAGELYDGTEIDEILTLRTLAMTDEEKAEARATDPRAAALLDRVESMDAPTMEQLHGVIRSMATVRPAGGGDGATGDMPVIATDSNGVPIIGAETGAGTGDEVPWWDPGSDASVSPSTDTIVVAGKRIGRGNRVTLRPGAGGKTGRRADAQDMFLEGRDALIEAVLEDVDGAGYLAVTLVDDPAAELNSAHGRFLYFSPDEVEPQ